MALAASRFTTNELGRQHDWFPPMAGEQHAGTGARLRADASQVLEPRVLAAISLLLIYRHMCRYISKRSCYRWCLI